MAFDATPDAEVTARDRMIRLRNWIGGLRNEQFDMVHWCGSATCIGGWARVMLGMRPGETENALRSWKLRRALGLTTVQAEALFFPDNMCGTTRAQAVAVLDHYLATGEIDWGVAA